MLSYLELSSSLLYHSRNAPHSKLFILEEGETEES